MCVCVCVCVDDQSYRKFLGVIKESGDLQAQALALWEARDKANPGLAA